MKLSKIEKYILELSKEELLFLLEVIEKMRLDAGSSPQAFDILQRFKEFRATEIVENSVDKTQDAAEVEVTQCDGCDTTTDVSSRLDPITNTEIPLCPKCLAFRTSYKT